MEIGNVISDNTFIFASLFDSLGILASRARAWINASASYYKLWKHRLLRICVGSRLAPKSRSVCVKRRTFTARRLRRIEAAAINQALWKRIDSGVVRTFRHKHLPCHQPLTIDPLVIAGFSIQRRENAWAVRQIVARGDCQWRHCCPTHRLTTDTCVTSSSECETRVALYTTLPADCKQKRNCTVLHTLRGWMISRSRS